MQKWYNSLSVGQRVIIGVVIPAVLLFVGGAIGKDTMLIFPLVGIVISVFFELGKRSKADD